VRVVVRAHLHAAVSNENEVGHATMNLALVFIPTYRSSAGAPEAGL
jgi:hypothetical protein